jgi:predicted phage terminase large subunit-like protein
LIRADGTPFDIYSLGKGCSIRGARGDIKIDDPQDKLDCESETVLQHDEEWLLSDILPILSSENRLIFVATPISPLSLAAKVKTLPGFTVFSSPLEVPVGSGRSCWPDMHPDWYLAEQKAIMGIDRFNAEYNCLPTVSGNPVFRAEWFKHYDPQAPEFERIKRELQYIVVGMDCAESKSDQADYTALVTLGMTYGSKPDVYILDVRRGKWSTEEGAQQLFLINKDWHQHKSVVESRVSGTATDGGDAMIQEIRRQQVTYGKNVNLYPFKPVHDKVSRAMSVQSFCQQGRVYLDLHNPKHQELMSELTMFTGTQNFHDDLVDAFDSGLMDVITRGAATIAPQIASALEGADW